MPFGIQWGFFRPAPLPTSGLYGLDGHYPRIRKAIGRMGEAYALGNAAVVVRCGPALQPAGELYVLLDDDFEAAFEDPTLPEGYRRRLMEAWKKSVMHTRPDDVAAVIVPSARLEALHREAGRRVIRMHPSWDVPAVFPASDFHSSPFKVAFLGTRSHLGDLELLRSALEDPRRDWEFHHFLGKGAPDWLMGCAPIISHRPLHWKEYRRQIGSYRFHLCVYPARATAVNEARSCNKVMEHAMTGAAALYSSHVPFSGLLQPMGARVLVDDDHWGEAVASLMHARDECMRLARETHQLAFTLAESSRSHQRGTWNAIAAGNG